MPFRARLMLIISLCIVRSTRRRRRRTRSIRRISITSAVARVPVLARARPALLVIRLCGRAWFVGISHSVTALFILLEIRSSLGAWLKMVFARLHQPALPCQILTEKLWLPLTFDSADGDLRYSYTPFLSVTMLALEGCFLRSSRCPCALILYVFYDLQCLSHSILFLQGVVKVVSSGLYLENESSSSI